MVMTELWFNTIYRWLLCNIKPAVLMVMWPPQCHSDVTYFVYKYSVTVNDPLLLWTNYTAGYILVKS